MSGKIIQFHFPKGADTARLTWRLVRDDYHLNLAGQGKTKDTQATYVQHLRQYGLWCDDARISIVHARRADVLRHVASVLDRYSRSYANTRISFLKSFYRWCIAEGRRKGDDPTISLKMRKENILPREPLTRGDLRRLLRACETRMESSLLMVLISTGIRRTELLRLQVPDVDTRHGLLLIHGKGLKQRNVAPGKVAMKELKRYLGERRVGPVWHTSKSGLKRILDGIASRAHVADVFPHRLRVTTICELLEAGADAFSVSVIAGHSVQMVQYYQRAVERRRAMSQHRRLSLTDRVVGSIPLLRRRLA